MIALPSRDAARINNHIYYSVKEEDHFCRCKLNKEIPLELLF